MSPSDTSLEEEEGADVDEADRDGADMREELLTQIASTKLCLAMFNGSGVYGTHDREVVGKGKRNRKMA